MKKKFHKFPCRKHFFLSNFASQKAEKCVTELKHLHRRILR